MRRELPDIEQEINMQFASSALVTLDHFADLYVVEVDSQQQVNTTKIDMHQFVGVRKF